VEIGVHPDVHYQRAEQTGRMTFDSNSPRQFTRSDNQKMLAGVCGGIAEYFGADVNLVRLLAVVATLVTGGTAALVYVAAWMLMPAK
jgi:phage shock protein PspC (stress-responsive transcriptional regulator)